MSKIYKIVARLDTTKFATDANRINQILDAAENKAERTRAKGEQNAARGRSREVAAEERKARQLEAIQDKMLLKEYQGRARAEQRKASEAERSVAREVAREQRKVAQLERIQDQFIRRDQRARNRLEAMRERESKRAAERMVSNSEASFSAMTGAAITFAGIAGRAVGEIYRDLDRRSTEAAQKVQNLKKMLGEEAGITGQPGVTGEVIKKNAEFSVNTGLGTQDASDFRRQFLGSVNVGEQKFKISGGKEGIDPAISEQFAVESAKRTARLKGDPGTAATMTGLLPMFSPIKSVEEGMNKLEGIRIALTEGIGDDSPLTRAFLDSAGTLVKEGGPIPTPEEHAAMIGTASLSGDAGVASTRAQQAVRELQFGLIKHTKIKGADQSQADYLHGIGVNVGMSFEQAINLLADDVEKASASAAAAGEGFTTEDYLGRKGFRNQEGIRALAEYAGRRDVFNERMKNARDSGKNQLGKKAMEANAQFMASTEGRTAVAGAMKDAAQTALGVRAGPYDAAMQAAEASPEIQQGDASGIQSMMDYAIGAMTFGGKDVGRKARIENIAFRQLNKRAAAAGVPRDAMRTAREWSDTQTDLPPTQAYFGRVESMIAERGGLPIETNAVIGGLEKAIRENTDALKGNRPGGGAPPPVPNRPPPRNQGMMVP